MWDLTTLQMINNHPVASGDFPETYRNRDQIRPEKIRRSFQSVVDFAESTEQSVADVLDFDDTLNNFSFCEGES